jgi:transcriptional regulator with XRE-family HTH domain
MEDQEALELISELIKDGRRGNKLSQRSLAEALVEVSGQDTVTRSDISRWERGKRIPTRHWLRWLSHVLNLPLPRLECAATWSRKVRTTTDTAAALSNADKIALLGMYAIPQQSSSHIEIPPNRSETKTAPPGAK